MEPDVVGDLEAGESLGGFVLDDRSERRQDGTRAVALRRDELQPFFFWHPWVFLLLVPVLLVPARGRGKPRQNERR